ncbi:MAG: dipeptidase [Thermoguttaceae bacterium]
MTTIEQYLESQKDRMELDLCEWLRIPSVSADPARKADMERAARWVADRLRPLGFAVEIIPTAGPPLVYAESPHVAGKPTALVYGHYDVQPAEPLELWVSPPFEPAVREGNLYARGATDDKGQVLTHVFGAQSWIATQGRLPLNVKFLIEGEEEVGSAALEAYLPGHAERLACDCVVISDGSQFAPGQPAITYGLRGIAYFELLLHGPNRDLHSGSFGGSVSNPANALTKMLAALVDERGRIRVPGFYDDVIPPTAREREQFARLPFDEKQYFAQLDVAGAVGEEGYTALERRWIRPTCDIHGLWSGYQGKGTKTVLPAEAGAKFSFRLVPNQAPERIGAALRAMLPPLCPAGIRMELIDHHGAPGVMVPLDSPYIQAGARAVEQAFGRAPVFTREGGSIPIVTAFHKALGADALLIGWGQDDDGAHGPNEKFSLADFHRGIRASACLWEELSR